jgi:predicted Zn-dependent protease
MTPPDTFEEMARQLALAGAAWSCSAEADLLARRAESASGDDCVLAGIGARGLRIAARILEQLAPDAPGRPPFRPLGLRGAVLAGHVAVAGGRPGQAELIGRAVAMAAPESSAGPRLVGQALFASGRFVEAEAALREASAVDPGDGITRALLAETLWFVGRREDAVSAFTREVARGGEGGRLAEARWRAARGGALDATVTGATAGGRS